MNQLQQITAQATRHKREASLLHQQIDHLSATSPEQLELTLSQAKRVMRECRLVVQELAILRDNLQPGGTR